MDLTALYIEECHLFSTPQILNFGGRFYFELNDKEIAKRENKNHLPNFYKKGSIQNLSAIVGDNGAGKTSLLKIIADCLNQSYGLNYVLIFENNNKILIKSGSNALKRVNLKFDYFECEVKFNSIYYSPHLDLKYVFPGLDISVDNMVIGDLDNFENKFIANERANPVRILKEKRVNRQIDFLLSKSGKELSKIFGIKMTKNIKVSFTRYKIELESDEKHIYFNNTPSDFRTTIQDIYDTIRLEAEEINKDRSKEITFIQKELFKNYFLMDLLCLFINIMEKDNKYLSEGHVNSKIPKNLKSKDKLFRFLKSHYFKFKSKKFQLLPIDPTFELIEYVNTIIDNSIGIGTKGAIINFDWSNKCIHIESKILDDFIAVQNNFLSYLDRYYGKGDGEFSFNELFTLPDLINFDFFERPLSSGQNALMNLFASFNYIFNDNFKAYSDNISNSQFVLLLDEADLGFHPKWKKKFVGYILEFFESYFNRYNLKVQIIITTHDPLTLSDILKSNIVYLKSDGGVINIDSMRIDSFASNISDLLAESFFIDDGLIGEFAKGRIEVIINALNDDKINFESIDWINSEKELLLLINQIGEPFLRNKLSDMFLVKFPKFQSEQEIFELKKRLAELNDVYYDKS